MKTVRILLFVILPLISVFFFSCNKDEEPEPHQILNNWNMEADVYGEARYWYKAISGNVVCSWDSLESVSPTHSLKMTSDDSTGMDIGYYYQRVLYIEKGQDLSFQIKVKGQNLVGNGVAVALYAFDNANPLTEPIRFASSDETIRLVGSFDWTPVKIEMENIEAEIKSLWIFLVYLPDTQGTAYFDDATAFYSEN